VTLHADLVVVGRRLPHDQPSYQIDLVLAVGVRL
jgi:hypothetical protein